MKKVPDNVLELPMEQRAEMAFREAVEEVIEEHVRLRLPIYISRNGEVVELSPEEIRNLQASNGH